MTAGIAIALAVGVAGLAAFLGAPKLAAGKKVSARNVASFALLVVLCAFFYLFCVLSPQAANHRWLGLAIMGATAALFRLLTRFEAPR